MLLRRLITALVLIPVVLLGVLELTTPSLAVALCAVVLLAAREWTTLAGLEGVAWRVAFYLVLTLGLIGGYGALWHPSLALWMLGLASLWWLLLTLLMARIRTRPDLRLPLGRLGKSLLGVFILVTCWAALVALHGSGDNGPVLLLFALTLTWVADSGAYFAGRRWGRRKLAPAISPGKSIEGVYGALAGAALWGALLAWYAPEIASAPVLILFCLIVCAVSVVGDLFESLLKRQAGIKDSGNLLPGHGGVLDRIDSLTAVAPVFAFGLMLLERLQ